MLGSPLYLSTDSEVLVHDLRPSEIDQVVAVHLAAFPGFFLSRMGSGFLRQYYMSTFRYAGAIMLAAAHGETVVGFVSGFLAPSRFYREMRSRWYRYLPPVLSAIARQPRLLATVASNVLRVRRAATDPEDPRHCELASIAVLPQARGSGLGRCLALAFLDRAWELGATRVRLTTDANDNSAANRFYQSLGFRLERAFVARDTRLMNEYILPRP